MRTTQTTQIVFLALAGLLAGPGIASANGRPLAQAALDDDGPVAAGAIENLRRAEQAGVDLLLAEEPSRKARAAWLHWSRVLDTVCAQRDCAASGLFWHTDLERARAAAERTGRPILSLRLLGRLDEEASCANSRFFRTALYPDPRVGRLLRERFVLHWEPVRPVPRLTIDFGDGRTLEGTITGNSVHYVLDWRGRLVDALPGLYGPGAFAEALERAGAAAQSLATLDDGAHAAARADYHRERLYALEETLLAEPAIRGLFGLAEAGPHLPGVPADAPPTAREALAMATTKAFVEAPVVEAISRGRLAADPVDWSALAARDPAAWRLGAASRRLLLAKHRGAGAWNGEAADSEQVIAGFERLVGLDTVRNEVLLHSRIHRWLTAPPALAGRIDLDAFNERVYAELFLTPNSDPWLGLASPETYLALEPGEASRGIPASDTGAASGSGYPAELDLASEPVSAAPASRSSAATIRRAEGALR